MSVKSVESPKTLPAPAAAPSVATPKPTPQRPKDYPLEMVAGVAAHLLGNCDHGTAAKEAIALLDACRNELAIRARHAANETEARARVKANYHMKWRELYEYITGETRENRAIDKLKLALERRIEAISLGVPKEEWLNTQIDMQKREGAFTAEELPKLKMTLKRHIEAMYGGVSKEEWLNTQIEKLKSRGAFRREVLNLRDICESIKARKKTRQKKTS